MKTRFLTTLTLTTLMLFAACSPSGPGAYSPFFSQETSPPPAARSVSGNYLAGRFAVRQKDWAAAEEYMSQVLHHDLDNKDLRKKTFLLALGSGHYDRARNLAVTLAAKGEADDIAHAFIAVEALSHGDAQGSADALAQMSDQALSAYLKPLIAAWTLAAGGKDKEALQTIAARAQQDRPSWYIHAGLMAELKNDSPHATQYYTKAMNAGLSLHAAVMVSEFLSRTGQAAEAQKIYRSLNQTYPFNPFVIALSQQKPDRLIRPNIARPSEGVGIAFYDLAVALSEKQAYDSAQIYAAIAARLLPQSNFVLLLRGDIAAINKQYAQSLDFYNSIPQDSPLYWLARLRAADMYEQASQPKAAAAILQDITENSPARLQALVLLGDFHRRQNNFPAAVAAYDSALKDLGSPQPGHWQIYYARGIALEKMQDWPRAEKDLQQALAFQPENPEVLNYLGYSWVDKGQNLARALEMLQHAVALKPDDGYILDSYGWAFYRLGKYEKSVPWIEKAVQFVPDDATILDHLGDAYWRTGRYTEARYKWKRSEELSKDLRLKETVSRKIRNGLPALSTRQKSALNGDAKK